MILLGFIISLATSCVQQDVSSSVTEHSVVEGARYAKEISEQSPFDTVEMSWREAGELMKVRNHDYREALNSYNQANEEQPLLQQLSKNVKGTVKISAGDALKPHTIFKMLNEPAVHIPKQLASLSKIKDINHTAKTDLWKHTAVAVDAEIKMRQNKVKLQSLLRTGELIDGEMKNIESATPLPADSDPKLANSVKKWEVNLQTERGKWLSQVRDFFNAEYGDVHFVKDASSLPTYENVKRPDLTEWERWCQLQRSKELVSGLTKAHQKAKPTLPGTSLVSGKMSSMLNLDEAETSPVRNTESVRSEARQLIQSWREMKEAQEKAEALEAEEKSPSFASLAQVSKRQTIFNLRRQEIRHASVVWMMDEQCWE